MHIDEEREKHQFGDENSAFSKWYNLYYVSIWIFKVKMSNRKEESTYDALYGNGLIRRIEWSGL